MTGHSNTRELSKIYWPDAVIEGITVDYDTVALRVRTADGSIYIVRADGYIGLSLLGFWDEVIVERVELRERHPGLDACIEAIARRHGSTWNDSGNLERNSRCWFALSIYLIDGCVLEIFAARLQAEPLVAPSAV